MDASDFLISIVVVIGGGHITLACFLGTKLVLLEGNESLVETLSPTIPTSYRVMCLLEVLRVGAHQP